MKKVPALVNALTLVVVLVGCGDNKPKPEPEPTCNQDVCVSQPEYDCGAEPPEMSIAVTRKDGVSHAAYIVEVFGSDGLRYASAVPVLDDEHPQVNAVVFPEYPLIVFSGATDSKELVRYTFDLAKCETTTV